MIAPVVGSGDWPAWIARVAKPRPVVVVALCRLGSWSSVLSQVVEQVEAGDQAVEAGVVGDDRDAARGRASRRSAGRPAAGAQRLRRVRSSRWRTGCAKALGVAAARCSSRSDSSRCRPAGRPSQHRQLRDVGQRACAGTRSAACRPGVDADDAALLARGARSGRAGRRSGARAQQALVDHPAVVVDLATGSACRCRRRS